MTCPTSGSFYYPFSAAEFFRDSPWLNIPPHRKGEILVESLYPRGGLKGGSSSSSRTPPLNTASGKMSKLAALAAARKKQTGKLSPVPESDKSTRAQYTDLLTRLGQKPKDYSSADTSLEDPKGL